MLHGLLGLFVLAQASGQEVPPAPLDTLFTIGSTTTWCTSADCGHRNARLLLPRLSGIPAVIPFAENLKRKGADYHVYSRSYQPAVGVGNSTLADLSFDLTRSDGMAGVPDPIMVQYLVLYSPVQPSICANDPACQPQAMVPFTEHLGDRKDGCRRPRWVAGGVVPVVRDTTDTTRCTASWKVTTRAFRCKPRLNAAVLFNTSEGPGWRVERSVVKKVDQGWQVTVWAVRLGGEPKSGIGDAHGLKSAQCHYALVGR